VTRIGHLKEGSETRTIFPETLPTEKIREMSRSGKKDLKTKKEELNKQKRKDRKKKTVRPNYSSLLGWECRGEGNGNLKKE